MSKIRAYYSTKLAARTLLDSVQFQNYSSNDSNFWLSNYRSNTHILILLNGDDRDHTTFAAQTGIKSIDFDDIRNGLNDPKDSIFITKAVTHIDGLNFSDFDSAVSIKDAVEVLIKHLDPIQKSLNFDNAPKQSGTFTDDFTGTNGQLLEARTGWTKTKDGRVDALISGNQLDFDIVAGSGDSAWISTDQGSADQYVHIYDVLFTAYYSLYLAIRLVDYQNFIGYHLTGSGGSGAKLMKRVGGAITDSIISTQGGVGYGFKIECEGTTIRFFRDTGGGFIQIGTDQTITDFQTETSAGLVSNTGTSAAKFDTYENGTVGGSTLLPSKLNQGQTLDNLDLIQQHVLAIDPINQGQTLDSLDLVQANILVINGMDQAQALDNVVLSTATILVINGINQGQTLEALGLIQQNTLVINGMDQAQAVNNITLSTDTILAIADMAQAQNIDVVNLIQQNTLVIDPLDQGQTLEEITLDVGVLLGIADIIQNQNLASLNLTQASILGIDGLEQGQVIDSVTLSLFEGKVIITLTIKSPETGLTISSPDIDLSIE